MSPLAIPLLVKKITICQLSCEYNFNCHINQSHLQLHRTVVVQTVNPAVPMVAGTARDLTSTINLTNVDDINVMVSFTWRTPMGTLLSTSPTQSANKSSFSSTLSISPLDSVTDSTAFACLVNINSDPADSFVIPATANDTVDITVQREY